MHRRTDDTFQFSLSVHHTILDGWSLFTFHAEVFHRDLRLLADPAAPQNPAPRSLFRDFIALERATVQSAGERRHWTEKFADYTPVTLPGGGAGAGQPATAEAYYTTIRGEVDDGIRQWRFTSTTDASHRSVESLLPGTLVEELVALAARGGRAVQERRRPPRTCKVIGTATGRHDVVTGVTANGRPEDVDSTDVCGMYLNMPPLRVDLAGGTWADLVRRVYEAEEEDAAAPLVPAGQHPVGPRRHRAVRQHVRLQPLPRARRRARLRDVGARQPRRVDRRLPGGTHQLHALHRVPA